MIIGYLSERIRLLGNKVWPKAEYTQLQPEMYSTKQESEARSQGRRKIRQPDFPLLFWIPTPEFRILLFVKPQ